MVSSSFATRFLEQRDAASLVGWGNIPTRNTPIFDYVLGVGKRIER
jgi:hypothetical protein